MYTLKKAAMLLTVFLSLFICTALTIYAEEIKSGTITGNVVNLREKPSTFADILDKIPKDTEVLVLDHSDGWYKINFEDTVGWVCGDYLSVKTTVKVTGYITNDGVRFRTGSSLEADVMGAFNAGDKVTIIGKADDWYKIISDEDIKGWVFGKYVSTKMPREKAESRSNSTVSRGDDDIEDIPEIAPENIPDDTSDTSLGRQIVNYAKKFIGVRYVWGGESSRGFDCSGLVKYVYNKFGIDMERVAASQATQGQRVKRSNLKIGDLVFFDTNGGHNSINHVGIYVGGGSFIHSPRPGTRVRINDMSSGFYERTYMTARRIID